MKRIIREAEFTAEQQNNISALAAATGLCPQTVAILYGRGIDTADKIDAFIHPSKERFLSPFLMSGMREAVELLTLARDEQWSVAVYGDYDADGVCASTVMARALTDFGIEVAVFVPERKQGYGLNVQSIDEIFEEHFPQLFITVDCGISNYEEVEYIKEQGAEVIVTDHHELPARLPDCICINPKIDDSYPYDNLCGAGVAFKVACALLGKQAYDYLDFVAIATVADSVPLTGENRDLVAEGLKLINSHPRKNYSEFLNKNGEAVTAQSLAFSVAPKVNAAGRMGDANAALKLFLESDPDVIYDYSVKLTEYNQERQGYCDELYLSAKQKIKEKGAGGRVIILWDESWNSGFVGIVAARIADEYCRPTMLFVKNGDMLKGSARSVEGVNIFQALKACSDSMEEFGGHAQAAGINIKEENLGKLEEELNEYLHANYPQDAFVPSYSINGIFKAPLKQKFVKELELLEPFGVGNRKPLFEIDVSSCNAKAIKAGSPHLSVKTEGLDMMFFSGVKYARLIRSAVPKRMVFEYNVSNYRGKEYTKGFIRDVIYGTDGCSSAQETVAANNLTVACGEETQCERAYISREEAQSLINRGGEYGTVFIANEISTLRAYELGGMEVNAFVLASGSLADVVLLSPQSDCNLSGYENVVFLDNPKKIALPSLEGKKIIICRDIDGTASLRSLSCDREELLGVYKRVSADSYNLSGDNAEEVAADERLGGGLQTQFALKVFEELGLIRFEACRVTVSRGQKTQLTNSGLYNFVSSLKE